MIVLAIDPGPETCGLVCYDTDRRVVEFSEPAEPVAEVLERITALASLRIIGGDALVAIERVQSYGISGNSLLRTAEVCGRLWDRAEHGGLAVELLYRREVLKALDITGKGNRDSLVRHRLIEMFGGTRQAAQGTKRAPGPLHGVASHGWAALAVAVVAAERMERC